MIQNPIKFLIQFLIWEKKTDDWIKDVFQKTRPGGDDSVADPFILFAKGSVESEGQRRINARLVPSA